MRGDRAVGGACLVAGASCFELPCWAEALKVGSSVVVIKIVDGYLALEYGLLVILVEVGVAVCSVDRVTPPVWRVHFMTAVPDSIFSIEAPQPKPVYYEQCSAAEEQ